MNDDRKTRDNYKSPTKRNYVLCFCNRIVAVMMLVYLPLAISPVISTSAYAAQDWPICEDGKRITCIVDGDTFWKDGIKYRLFDTDTPEIGKRAKCRREHDLAIKATYHLQSAFNSGLLDIIEHGRDLYDRILAEVIVNGVNVSVLLIREGVGRPYDGSMRDPKYWCN